MTRSLALTWMMTVVVLGLAGSRVYAQDTPAAQAAPAQPAAQQPKPPSFHGSVSVSFGAASGVQAQRSHEFQATLVRPFSDGGRFVANGARQYQKVTFPSQGVLADRTNILVGVDHDVTKYTVAMVRSMYLKDSQLLINSRYEQLAGYGLHLYNKGKTIDFDLVPGVSLYKEDLAFAENEGWKRGYGFFQKFSAKIHKVWTVQNSFRFRRDFSDAHRSIESVASLTGMVTKTVGMQFQHQYNYESIVPPGFPNYLSMVMAGLKFEF
jgi:hypothetical protein